MKRLPIQSLCFLTAVLCIVGLSAFAKDPISLQPGALLPAIHNVTGSLTPPPKEWAMFPDESAPAAPVTPPAGQNAAPANAAGASGSSGAAATGGTSSSIVSAPNVRTAPHRELPILWMLITGALSLGAVVACASLIVSQDAPEESELESEEVPEVSELQEITA